MGRDRFDENFLNRSRVKAVGVGKVVGEKKKEKKKKEKSNN